MSERTGFSPSLTDVARLAGVSQPTASKALNNRLDVSEATRARVEAAARELGYVPNALARGLVGGRSGSVGVVTSDLEGRFAIPILTGVEEVLGADQILAFLCDARGDDIREQHLIKQLVARKVEGIIIVGDQTDVRPSLGPDLPVPVTYAYCMSDDPRDVSITVDNAQIGQVAAQHLVDTGRRRIAHISGEAPHLASRLRWQGACHALEAAGLHLSGSPLFGDWSEGWGRAAMEIVLERGEAVDAVLCGSDQIARGVLDTLRERSIAVPRDMAVMGTDNWHALAANARPALSTVDLNLAKVGRIAAKRLFAPPEDRTPGVEYVQGEVVIRDSTIMRG